MKLIKDTREPNRGLAAAAGGLKGLLALVMLWLGMHSLLVGWAYQYEKGAWVPMAVGGLLVVIGVRFLWRGVRQVSWSLHKGHHGL